MCSARVGSNPILVDKFFFLFLKNKFRMLVFFQIKNVNEAYYIYAKVKRYHDIALVTSGHQSVIS
jgi:adenosine/AMP kinase